MNVLLHLMSNQNLPPCLHLKRSPFQYITLFVGYNLKSDFEGLIARGCKACGKEELERGCNGERRIQGRIATVPGFGWWPIKAYRPCPAFVASGGCYKRRGHSMDDVASGGGGPGVSPVGTADEPESR
ncbi:hypothetical protein F3Y22_tig00110221pilonHSYRG00435 [Hibiscus syriacus]|uniref:Uncharacterized protein n=1 Tax=Hibiscus syriacus TaxID=106335 RepID=A0A6A3B840_HIBSY|nr:hypothetical protein F3Y22_tig00110221pilonHSYRG00435 [Hibiscus syriacus]